VSEGRELAVVREIAEAFSSSARLFDIHSDIDHNRSVCTLVGVDGDDALVDSLLAGIRAAAGLIDLREHDGVHPRVGAADVVPLVPLVADDMERARNVALRLGERVGSELGLPVFLYGEVGAGRRPAFFRLGGPVELQRRISVGELVPDFGPDELDPRAGAVLVGARAPLVAFNVLLASDDVDVAGGVAAAVRESSGGMPGVQALGFRLASSGRAQVSVNVIDVDRASLHEVIARITAEARERGVGVDSCELVGLLPARAVVEAAAVPLGLPGLHASRVLELRVLEEQRD